MNFIFLPHQWSHVSVHICDLYIDIIQYQNGESSNFFSFPLYVWFHWLKQKNRKKWFVTHSFLFLFEWLWLTATGELYVCVYVSHMDEWMNEWIFFFAMNNASVTICNVMCDSIGRQTSKLEKNTIWTSVYFFYICRCSIKKDKSFFLFCLINTFW